MAHLTVLEYPDKRLRKKALPVLQVDDSIRTIIDDMFETMYADKGVGLAATQVNIHQQIIVMDISDEGNSPICLVNPEIIHREGLQYEQEGCLSVPDLFDRVKRSAKIRIRALDREGKVFELDAEALLAICIQHEIDHLNGILFIDHLSRLKQERLSKKVEKARLKIAG